MRMLFFQVPCGSLTTHRLLLLFLMNIIASCSAVRTLLLLFFIFGNVGEPHVNRAPEGCILNHRRPSWLLGAPSCRGRTWGEASGEITRAPCCLDRSFLFVLPFLPCVSIPMRREVGLRNLSNCQILTEVPMQSLLPQTTSQPPSQQAYINRLEKRGAGSSHCDSPPALQRFSDSPRPSSWRVVSLSLLFPFPFLFSFPSEGWSLFPFSFPFPFSSLSLLKDGLFPRRQSPSLTRGVCLYRKLAWRTGKRVDTGSQTEGG